MHNFIREYETNPGELSNVRIVKTNLQWTRHIVAICVKKYKIQMHTVSPCGKSVTTLQDEHCAKTAQIPHVHQITAKPVLYVEIQLAKKQPNEVIARILCQQ